MTLPNNVGNPSNRYSFGTQPQRPAIPRFSAMDQSLMLPGFYVSSEDEIRPGDVNMDGSISFFPSKDLQKIYIRQWNKNGELERLTYTLTSPAQEAPQPLPPAPQQQQASPESAIVQALNGLNNGLANTFSQFGAVMQSMNQKLESMDQAISNFHQVSPDDGGRG